MKQLFIIFVLLALLTPVAVSAVLCDGQENGLNLCYPQFPGAPFLQIDMPLTQIIAWVYIFVVGISGLAAFVMIVWAGIQWMTSTGDPTKTSDAKDKIRNALLGLLLILASFVLLQTINPELTRLAEFKINPLLNPPLTAGQFAKDGVYVSDVFAFLCDGPCIEGSRADGADYFWYDPAVWGVSNAFGDPGGVADLGSWGDHISSVRIVGPYGLLFADGKDFKKEVICFQQQQDINLLDPGGYGVNLDTVFHDEGSPWSKDGAQSLKILGFGVCSQDRITFPDEATFWSTATPTIPISPPASTYTGLTDLKFYSSKKGITCSNRCSLELSDLAGTFVWSSKYEFCRGENDLSPIGLSAGLAPQSFIMPSGNLSVSTSFDTQFYTILCTTADNSDLSASSLIETDTVIIDVIDPADL